MEKMSFTIKIEAPRERIWETLWNDETYREWTKFFEQGSHAVSDWEEGSEVKFLTSTGEGMYSVIDKKIENEYIRFKHLGSVIKGERVPFQGEHASWAGALETYELKDSERAVELTAEVDTVAEYVDFTNDTFPKALSKLKELSES